MYKHRDSEEYISLHDCRAEAARFEGGVLSFVFPDGFWTSPLHPENSSDATVLTGPSQADFRINGGGWDGIAVRLFHWNDDGNFVGEIWKPENFINAVNAGEFSVEFITRRNENALLIFECWLVCDTPPYHLDCEIKLNCEAEAYLWNELRYDRPW